MRTPALVSCLLLALASCRGPAPAAAPAPAAPGYTLVLIKTGPNSGRLDKATNDEAFAGHFANMDRMVEEGQLLVAGPFGTNKHDASLRGLFVMATADRAEAERWASTDPTTRAGVFVLEYHDLATDAPLRRALQADVERRERLEAEGKTPSPGDGARPYVLLFAEHGDLARRELAPLQDPEGGVYLVADLDGSRALVLLDAGTKDEAEERFAPQLEALGSHQLSEWFASAQLARMVEPAGR